MPTPAIGRRAFIPTSMLTPKDVERARRTLLFTEVSKDSVTRIAQNDPDVSVQVIGKSERVSVNEFKKVAGGYSVPRAWAMSNFPHIRFTDRTVFPNFYGKYTGSIKPRDAQQRRFFRDLLSSAKQRGPQNILANATTGSGKTVAGLFLGSALKTPTLIVVDSNKLATGWVSNISKLFGESFVDNYVGRAQQSICDYKDKAFVITLAQSLRSRRYPSDFYKSFGLVIVDEVHVFGGPHYSPVLHMFPARVRAYLTAENRGGSFGRLIMTHTGEPRVVSKQEVMKPDAWVIRNKLDYTFYSMTDGALISNLAKVDSRNRKLAKLIKTRGHDRGRHVLVLSDRVDQLMRLRKLCKGLGIPDSYMGLHVGAYTTSRKVVRYCYDGSTKYNRLTVVATEKEAKELIHNITKGRYDDLPKPLATRLQAGESVSFDFVPERIVPSQSELDNITNYCHIIFATYKIFAKGIDVPRLDMGVEALPAGNIKQPVGRVLRILPGKSKPEWYAIHDYTDKSTRGDDGVKGLLNAFFESKTTKRLMALRNAGARIKMV